MENNKLKINFRGTGTTAGLCARFSPFRIHFHLNVLRRLHIKWHNIPFPAAMAQTHRCRYIAPSSFVLCSRCAVRVCVCRLACVRADFSNAFRVYKTECEPAIVIRITHCTSLHLTACYMALPNYRQQTVSGTYQWHLCNTVMVYRYLHTLRGHHMGAGRPHPHPLLSATQSISFVEFNCMQTSCARN